MTPEAEAKSWIKTCFLQKKYSNSQCGQELNIKAKKKKKKYFFFTGQLCWKGLVCYEQLHTSFCSSGFLISISFLYEGNTGFYMRAALALNGLIEHPQKSALVAVFFGKSLTSKLKNCEVIVTDFLWKVITSVSIKTPADN